MAERRHPDLDVGGPGVQGGSTDSAPGSAALVVELRVDAYAACVALEQIAGLVGDDGLTPTEREAYRAEFWQTKGRQPEDTPERRERIQRLRETGQLKPVRYVRDGQGGYRREDKP